MRADVDRLFEAVTPLNWRRTTNIFGMGRTDPTARQLPEGYVRALHTPEGMATVALSQDAAGLRVQGWGPGARWAVQRAPDLVGARDDPAAFAPEDPRVAELVRRFPGLRIGNTATVYELLVPVLCGQLIATREATAAWIGIVREFGHPAPGPYDLGLPPTPREMLRIPEFAFRKVGLMRRFAETLLRCCAVIKRLEEARQMPLEDALRRLQAVPGVGPWTAGHLAQAALGHADAVVIGDWHLPNTVSLFFGGPDRSDDARMLELLEPFRPHRGRVTRLILATGLSAPRRGPRIAPTSMR